MQFALPESVELRAIPGWSGIYSASSNGRIWSHVTDRWLKPTLNSQGYFDVGLHRDGEQKTFRVHRLVALAFHGSPALEQTHINHKDSNRTNNRPENLEWCTHGENIAHAWKAGAMKVTPTMAESLKRVQKGRRLLSDADAAEIRRRVTAGESQASLAREKGASRALINMIVKNHRYQPTGGTNAV